MNQVEITMSIAEGLKLEYQGNTIIIPDIVLANKVITQLHKMATMPRSIEVIIDK